ncbi:MAG TPA: hypothetical protein VKR57_12325 [Terriglobales bacterium]|nr:hypothetical protein [Terriglobales bacterium]
MSGQRTEVAAVSAESPRLPRLAEPDWLGSPEEMAQTLLGLMKQMEASLQGSHTAVLASDGLGLENCTREQARLQRAVELLLGPQAWPGTGTEKDDLRQARSGESRFAPRFVTQCPPQLRSELLAEEWRVLQGTRVQAALLRRARQFQCILANLAAIQGSHWGAWLGQRPPW